MDDALPGGNVHGSMSTICVEVVGMMVVVIIVIKEWVENNGDVDEDDSQVMERGDVKECGGYSVREREGGCKMYFRHCHCFR